MATERQIAANRRNARKSTGPRSRGGRKRASRNSYRHGLSSGVAAAGGFAKRVDVLARKIAGAGADAVTLELARSAATAEFDLTQIRRIRVALIARMSEFGEFEVRRISTAEEIRHCAKALKRGDPIFPPFPALSSPPMPSSEPERSAEAIRRALPELLKLDRYERRAAARRDRAMCQIANRKIFAINQ
jgi:hypothetical protein